MIHSTAKLNMTQIDHLNSTSLPKVRLNKMKEKDYLHCRWRDPTTKTIYCFL